MNKRILQKIVVGVLLLLGISIGTMGKALAADQASIKSKAMFEGVYNCYMNEKAFISQFMATNPQNFIKNNGSSTAVKLPYGWTKASNNDLTCKEAMMDNLIPKSAQDGNNITNVKNYFAGQATSAGAGDAINGTGGIGYKATAVNENGGTGKQAVYTISSATCASGEPNATVNGKKTITFPAVAKTNSGLYVVNNNYGDVPKPGSNGIANFTTCGGMTLSIQDESWGDNYSYYVISPDGSTQTISYSISGNGISASTPEIIITNGGSTVKLNAKVNNVTDSTKNMTTDYKLVWGGKIDKMLTGLNSSNSGGYKVSGLSGYDGLKLTKQEVYDLYTYYIEQVFGAKLVAEGSSDYEGTDINLCSVKKYKVNKTNAKDASGVYGVDSSYHFTAGPLSLDDVISTLDGLGTFDDINNGGKCNEKTEEEEKKDDGGGGGGTTGESDSFCDDLVDQYTENKGIGAMQWVICPGLNNTTYTASTMDNITQNMLEVKADRYNTSSGTFKGWELVRNVANVLMVVFLMVIIVSQLTGKGIDNYGVKKMLPRLITMAIIINLSFYICELAIDLSNIAGVGLRDMFGGFGAQINGISGNGENHIMDGVMGLFASASTAGGAAVGAGTAAFTLGVGGVAAIAIGAAVLVIVVIIALLVLWLMLGAREVIIIFCVIISPLAFACFILPNTQNLFKKWWELFKAAIIIFPICGAVAGISYMLKSMSWDNIGVAGQAILLVLPYLGFFLLPMLLKNALAALGKVGGALTTLGNTVRSGGRAITSGAMKVAQNSDTYKNLSTEAARRRQAETSQRTIDRLEALKKQKEAEGGKLSDRDARRLYEAQQTQNKIRLEQGMVDAGAVEISDEAIKNRAMSAKEAQEFKNYTDQYSGYTRAQMGDELQAAVTAYDGKRTEGNALRLQAAIATAESRGMNQEMLNYIGGYHKDANGNDILDRPLLSLSASNANDAKILSRLSSSNNKVISQYGIQMSKPTNTGQELSMGDFAASAGPVKMSDAFANKGPAILNNMDDDTLEYINKRGGSKPVVSSAMLANAAASTTNQKELRQINDMFSKMNSDNISFSGKQLANFDNSTIETLMSRVKPNSKLQGNFVAATNDIANSPELMGSLRPEQRTMLNAVRRGAGVGEMAASTSASNSNSTPTQTGGHTPTFEGGAGI